MQEEEINKIINERLATLPVDIQEAILKSDFETRVFEIGKKHELSVDKIELLFIETNLVMLGFTHPGEFLDKVESKLGVSLDIAEALVADINKEIFEKIRESLKKIYLKARYQPEKEEDEESDKKPRDYTDEEIDKFIAGDFGDEEKEIEDYSSGEKTTATWSPGDQVAGPEIGENKVEKASNTINMGGITEQKLGQTTYNPKTETDYSLKNLTPEKESSISTEAPRRIDPYKEAV